MNLNGFRHSNDVVIQDNDILFVPGNAANCTIHTAGQALPAAG